LGGLVAAVAAYVVVLGGLVGLGCGVFVGRVSGGGGGGGGELGVAVQVAFGSKGLKPILHFIGSRVETRHLSSYGSTGFNLYRSTLGEEAEAEAAALAAATEAEKEAEKEAAGVSSSGEEKEEGIERTVTAAGGAPRVAPGSALEGAGGAGAAAGGAA
jgi:hypothetical protein